MSSTRCAAPQISADSATAARSMTPATAGQPWCSSPRSAVAGSTTLSNRTSHNLRVSSTEGRTRTATPSVPLGTRKRLIPSSIVLPSRERAATTSTSARWASGTKSLVPERVNPPRVSRAERVMLAASQRAPDLFHQHDEVDQAEPTAAIRLVIGDAEPALLGELLPELASDRRLRCHHLAHECRRALAVEEFARGVAQQFLFFRKADVHAALQVARLSTRRGEGQGRLSPFRPPLPHRGRGLG